MKTQYFKFGGDNHMIDNGGNHFVNGVCVNPLDGEGKIGDTHPPVESREPAITITGHQPHVLTQDKRGNIIYKAVWK